MYTSTTVCSLCIVELQQRHSKLVNGAITSNNMSYLTKTLSHCHWMCFMSNKKKKCFVRLSCAFSCLWKLQESAAALQKKIAASFHQVSVYLLYETLSQSSYSQFCPHLPFRSSYKPHTTYYFIKYVFKDTESCLTEIKRPHCMFYLSHFQQNIHFTS